MNNVQKKTKDLTSGNILKVLFGFAIPLFASSLFQQLYNTADLIFVGNFTGKTGAAAVGASGIIVVCVVGLFTGISVGAGVAISQYIGGKDSQKATKTVETALAFAFVGGIVMTIVGEILVKSILELLQTPATIMPEAMQYVRIYFIGLLPMIIYNMGAAILRSCGDSKTPFYILAAGGFLNVLMDYIMIVHLGLGVAGAGIATTISQGFSAIAILIFIFKYNTVIPVKLNQIRFQKGYIGKILHYGLPTGVQTIIITFSNIMVQYYINGYGENAMAAFSAYFKLENILYLPAVAFGQTITTFAGQNTGAGDFKRVKKGMGAAAICGALIVAAISAVIMLFPQQAIGCFVKDKTVMELGMKIIFVAFPFYWLYPLMEVFGGTIRGMGYSFMSMVIILTNLCGVRIALLWVFNNNIHTFESVAVVYPITWALTVCCFVAAVWKVLKTNIESQKLSLKSSMES